MSSKGFISSKILCLRVKIVYEKKNIRVLPDDTDAFGRLNWLAYLRYCEEGEAGLFDKIGFSAIRFYRDRKISFARRAASFEYCSEVSPDSYVDIETSLKKIGRTSFTLQHTFYKKNSEDGERMFAASAQVTAVAFDHVLRQKIEIPVELRELIRRTELAEHNSKRPQCTA
jgi:YbgC/YbaW family acyl-CoA thioester hydrolase